MSYRSRNRRRGRGNPNNPQGQGGQPGQGGQNPGTPRDDNFGNTEAYYAKKSGNQNSGNSGGNNSGNSSSGQGNRQGGHGQGGQGQGNRHRQGQHGQGNRNRRGGYRQGNRPGQPGQGGQPQGGQRQEGQSQGGQGQESRPQGAEAQEFLGQSGQGQGAEGLAGQSGQEQGGYAQNSQGESQSSAGEGGQGEGGEGQSGRSGEAQGQGNSGQGHRQGGGDHRQGGQGQGGYRQGQGGQGNRQGGHNQGGQGQGGRHRGGRGRRNRGGGGGGAGSGGGPGRDRPMVIKRSNAEVTFLNKTPITPNEWIRFEKGSSEASMRAIDLLCPVGKGQRGLIVSPPKVGKTTILKQICQATAQAYPDMKVYLLLVDERPEEVTDFRRSVKCEIFASSSDRGFRDHMRMADEVYQRAVADAAAGKDAMIVLDSLTRLARAYNSSATGNKTLSGGLDSRAMEVPRRFFGAARKLEEGGSLTILATILIDTNSRMDEVIFQEFKGTGNMELVLSRTAAEQRIFPAIHVKNSGTRREELLLPPADLEKVWALRRKLAVMGDLEGTKTVVELIKRNKTNEVLLANIVGGM